MPGIIPGAIEGAVNPPAGYSRWAGAGAGAINSIPMARALQTFWHMIHGTTGDWGDPANNPFTRAAGAGTIAPGQMPQGPGAFEGDPTDPNNPNNFQLGGPGQPGQGGPPPPQNALSALGGFPAGSLLSRPGAQATGAFDQYQPGGVSPRYDLMGSFDPGMTANAMQQWIATHTQA